jgi:MFS family permease
MTALQITTVSAAFVFGMVLALLGSLKLALAKRLNLGEGRIGGLLMALNAAVIPMMLLTGWLIDRWGVQPVLIVGSIVTSAAVLSLSLQPTYARAFGALLAAGLGAAALSTAAVVLMPQAFFGKEHLLSASINLGFVFVALGALLTPAVIDLLMRGLEFRRTAGVLSFVCLAPAVAAAITPAGELIGAGGKGDPIALVQDYHLWLAAAVFLFYAPLEAAVSIWATTYLTDLGNSERRSAWLLSGFWAAFLVSRLAMAYWQYLERLHPYWDKFMLVLLCLLAAAVIGNLAGTAKPTSARGWFLLLGLLLGPIFPMLIGLAFQTPGLAQARGTTYGVLFAAGSLGSLIAAPLIAVWARSRNVQAALRIPMVLALLAVVAALAFGLTIPPIK